MPLQSIWDEPLQIRYTEGDFYRKWKLNFLFMALQEAAARHALSYGLGYDELVTQDLAWILSRLKIRFNSLPTAGEQILIRTWPKGIQQKLFFLRDFLVLDAKSEYVYAAACSAWLLINKTTRQMIKPAVIAANLPDNSNVRPALDEPMERIVTTGEMKEQFTIQARASMLDLMGHVTSACYLEWIADCFPFQAYQDDALAWLQINFNHEVKPGECIAVARARSTDDPNAWFIRGANLDTGNGSFDAALGFRSIGL